MRMAMVGTWVLALALLWMLPASPAHAQSESEMELQRCVWGCLARSNGNTDPAYHACVAEVCMAGRLPEGQVSPDATDRVEQRGPDRDTVRFVQERLMELGYDPGPRDGVLGRNTEAAIRAFRGSRGLGSSSHIDDDLLERLEEAGNDARSSAPPIEAQPAKAALDVPVMEHGGDGQAANCASSTVAGLDPAGDGFLAVRSGPGTDYRMVDQLRNGDTVYTFDQKGDWVGIVYGAVDVRCTSTVTRPVPYDKKGWVHGRWLRHLAG